MKQILTSIMLVIAASAFSQQDTTKAKVGGYAAISYSITNGDNLREASYFTVEGGVTYKSFSVGVGIGRGSFLKDVERNQWFVEPKATFTFVKKGPVSGFLIGGAGGYFFREKPHFFIEYGAGATFDLKKLDLCIQASSWDGLPYLSVGFSKSF